MKKKTVSKIERNGKRIIVCENPYFVYFPRFQKSNIKELKKMKNIFIQVDIFIFEYFVSHKKMFV